MAEWAELPGYNTAQWAAPAGTPADVIVRVHAELNRALPDAKQRKAISVWTLLP
jgi:hypothetical protein